MEEKLSFENSKGDKIVGVLSGPEDNNVPIAILVHGHSSSKETKSVVDLQEKLNKKDIASLRIDLYGHGESDGRFEDATISEAVDSILSAIRFVKEKGYTKIGLMGSSYGGMSSTMAASKTNDLIVLALKSPVSDYEEIELLENGEEGIREWKEKGFIPYHKSDGTLLKLNYIFYEDIKNNIAYEAAEKIKIPVLIVHGDADKDVPVKQSKKISKIFENCKLEIIPGADHRYTNSEDFEKCTGLLADFLITNLNGKDIDM